MSVTMFGTKEVTTITNTPMPFWLKRSTLEFNFYPALPSLGRCGNPLCISALAITRPLHVGVVGEALLPCQHGRTSGLFPKLRRPAICSIRLCMSPGGGRGGGWTPLCRGEHRKGLVAVGHLVGMTLRAGCSACPCRGMWLPIPPGRHMYALHLIGPELPTRLGMLSISVLMVHYAQRSTVYPQHPSFQLTLELMLAR